MKTSFENMSGAEMIAAERARQVSLRGEGYDDEHDDEHDDGELVRAAVCYAENAVNQRGTWNGKPSGWPWDAIWWKPKAPIRDLTRAGALIAAEIDRRLRAGEKP